MKPFKLTIAITGGIAGYKVVDLLDKLKLQKNIKVKLILTQNAIKLFGTKIFTEVCKEFYTDVFEEGIPYQNYLQNQRRIPHIYLADNTDLLIITPATANTISKIAGGLADDLLCNTVLATTAPTWFFPAMNTKMWQNSILRENITKLKNHGFQIFEPSSGDLACGYEGVGRMPEVDFILQQILEYQNRYEILKGKKVIVTGGGTSEKIDPIRVLTNQSSGKMATAIADECAKLGAEVIYLKSKNAVSGDFGIAQKTFETTQDLQNLLHEHLPTADIIFHAAAVSDFKPDFNQTKISSSQGFNLKLKPNQKLLPDFKKSNPNIFVVSFKAETEPDETKLSQKAHKNLLNGFSDIVVANDVSSPEAKIGSDQNSVLILTSKNAYQKIELMPKKLLAKEVLKVVVDKFYSSH